MRMPLSLSSKPQVLARTSWWGPGICAVTLHIVIALWLPVHGAGGTSRNAVDAQQAPASATVSINRPLTFFLLPNAVEPPQQTAVSTASAAAMPRSISKHAATKRAEPRTSATAVTPASAPTLLPMQPLATNHLNNPTAVIKQVVHSSPSLLRSTIFHRGLAESKVNGQSDHARANRDIQAQAVLTEGLARSAWSVIEAVRNLSDVEGHCELSLQQVVSHRVAIACSETELDTALAQVPPVMLASLSSWLEAGLAQSIELHFAASAAHYVTR